MKLTDVLESLKDVIVEDFDESKDMFAFQAMWIGRIKTLLRQNEIKIVCKPIPTSWYLLYLILIRLTLRPTGAASSPYYSKNSQTPPTLNHQDL